MAVFDGDEHESAWAPEARTLEARARSLRNTAQLMDPISGQAFSRRASALELVAFALRSRSCLAGAPCTDPARTKVVEAVA